MEYEVKLAFLYKFTKFIEWPVGSFRSEGAPLSIGIVGGDPFSPRLEQELRTRSVGSHPIVVRTLRPGDRLNEYQMLFIALTAKDRAASIVAELRGSNTLTVSETDGFGMLGGAINFAVVGKKLQLEINPLAAQRAGLKVSSKLLGIATIIKER